MVKQKATFMRADKDLLNILKECKISDRESYAEVVRRLIKKNAFVNYRKEVLKKKLRSQKSRDPYYMTPKQQSEHNAFLKKLERGFN